MAATTRARKKRATVGALKRVDAAADLGRGALAVFCVDRTHEVFGKTQTTRPVRALPEDTKTFDPETCLVTFA